MLLGVLRGGFSLGLGEATRALVGTDGVFIDVVAEEGEQASDAVAAALAAWSWLLCCCCLLEREYKLVQN